jgi:hypothetical protein
MSDNAKRACSEGIELGNWPNERLQGAAVGHLNRGREQVGEELPNREIFG